MDLTVLHLAVPALSADLQPSSAQLLWIIDIYGFMVAGSLITMGTLGDRIGRRRLLLIGAAAFGVTSVLAAFSTTPEMLIAARALLGRGRRDAGAVNALPDPQHVPRPAAAHHRNRRSGSPASLQVRRSDRSSGAWCWSSSGGARCSCSTCRSWSLCSCSGRGSCRSTAIPTPAAPTCPAPRCRWPRCSRVDLRAQEDRAGRGDADGSGHRTRRPGLGVVFVRRQRRLVDPLIDLSLFRIPAFSAALATYGIGDLRRLRRFPVHPAVPAAGARLSPLEAGLWTLPWALAFIVGSNVDADPGPPRSTRPGDGAAGWCWPPSGSACSVGSTPAPGSLSSS